MGVELLRCDDRLIHGQCIVRVISDGSIEHIVLVDDFTASSPVLCNIYKMAVPPNVDIQVVMTSQAPDIIGKYAESKGKTMVLVKDPCVALTLQQTCQSLPKELNIGPMSNRNDTKKATYYSYLLKPEQDACDQLLDMGIQVYFQQVPDEKKIAWESVR